MLIVCFRVRDWLYGIRNAEPEPASSIEPQTEAERLRVISYMITLPTHEGGAGITPDHGEWKNVTAIFPLHDEETNKRWMREWSQKTFLSDDDSDQIRNKFGESVGVSPCPFRSRSLTVISRSGSISPFSSRTFGSSCFLPYSGSRAGSSWAAIRLYTPLSTVCGASFLSSTGSARRKI